MGGEVVVVVVEGDNVVVGGSVDVVGDDVDGGGR